MKVIVTGDHAGMTVRNEVNSVLEELGFDYEDTGPDSLSSVDYPDFAVPAAKRIANGELDRGIFIGGTGIGMSTSADSGDGIRAALTHYAFSANATREHKDSNVVAMGERVIGPGLAREIVQTWLTTDYVGGRNTRRIEKMMQAEKE